MKRKSYSGVGSRETPLYILYMMSQLAMIFEKKGYVLRSGCALGADAAFEDALSDPAKNAEIYIPNMGFPKKMGTFFKKHYIIPEKLYGTSFNSLYNQATRLIHKHDIHKAWQRCPPYVMKLHNRNMFQVLGIDLKSKSNFNVCYTSGGETKYEDTNQHTGGTGTAINASDIFKVPLFNLSVDEHYIRLNNFIEENKHLINQEKLDNIIPRSDYVNKRKDNKEDGEFIYTYKDMEEIRLKQKRERDKKAGLIVIKKNEQRLNNNRITPNS